MNTTTSKQMTTFFSGNHFSTTHFNKLPDELIFHIRSFNFDWAAKVIQYRAKVCFKKKINVMSDLLTFSLINLPISTKMIKVSVFYKNKVLSAKDILKTFSACKCCQRHQNKKPKKLSPWTDTTFYGIQYSECECKCRHLSRFICRSCD